MPNSSRSLNILDSKLFFEKALKFGIDKGILNKIKIKEIEQQATKGILQIAEHFGSSYLYSDLQDARKRLVNLVSLYLEFSSNCDINKASNLLASKNLLYFSRKGNELLLKIFHLPEISIFGYISDISIKEFQKKKLSLKKPYSINDFNKDLQDRLQVKELMTTALWCSKILGISENKLVEDAAPADFVIRSYILTQWVGQSKCKTEQDFIKIFLSAREKYKSIKKFRLPNTLELHVSSTHQKIVEDVRINMEKYDVNILFSKNEKNAFENTKSKYYIPTVDLITDANYLDNSISKEWKKITNSKEDDFTFQTILFCVAANLPPTPTLSISKAKKLIRNIKKFNTNEELITLFIENHVPFEIKNEFLSLWEILKSEIIKYITAPEKRILDALKYLESNCIILKKIDGLNMTIIEAAIAVLSNNKEPLSAESIYQEICRQELFIFRAKKPIVVLRAELKRHSSDYSGKNPPSKFKLKQHPDKTYSLI
jgi:hypothetical protein